MNLEQLMKKSKTNIVECLSSPKLDKLYKIFNILMLIIACLGITTFVLISINELAFIILVCGLTLSLICEVVVYILIFCERKKISKGSFIYLTPSTNPIIEEIAQFFLILIVSSILYDLKISINIDAIHSINIALFSLIFALYIFIIPSSHKFLEVQTKKYRKNMSAQKMHIQGKVYELKTLLNKTYYDVVVMTIVCITSTIFYFTNHSAYITSAWTLFAYIFFNFFQLLYFVRVVYYFYIKKVEQQMTEECIEVGLLQQNDNTTANKKENKK